MPTTSFTLSKFLLFFSAFSLLAFTSFTTSAFAQEAGVSITPAVIEETLEPGTVKSYAVTIRNLNNVEQTFYLSSRNISGVQDGGVPIFADENAERTGYEIVDWLTLSENQVIVPAGQTAKIDFSLSVPDTATPGSHFGGIFISVDPPELQNSGAAVGYQVANIVSIRVAGDANEGATIRQFSTGKFLYGSPNVDFAVRIENTGNVLIRPSGPLEIKNMLGQTVDTFTFNESKNAVFPESVREFTAKWEGLGSGFGRYEAIVSPVFGDAGAKRTISSTVSFWILPMNIIGPALAVLAVLLLGTYLFVRIYIKRTLARMAYGTGRRVVQKRRKSGGTSATLLLTIVMLAVTGLFLIVLLVLFA